MIRYAKSYDHDEVCVPKSVVTPGSFTMLHFHPLPPLVELALGFTSEVGTSSGEGILQAPASALFDCPPA